MSATSPTIVFNIDGVVLDFFRAFKTWHNARYADFEVVIDPEHYYFTHEALTPSMSKRIEGFVAEGEHDLALVDTNMPSCIRRLQLSGIRVIGMTTYPHLESRATNLKNHGIAFDALLHKSSRFPSDVVAVVEDCPAYVAEYVELSHSVFVPRWKYTKDLRGCTHYSTADELFEALQNLAFAQMPCVLRALHPGVKAPKFGTAGAAAFDLFCHSHSSSPYGVVMIKTGIMVAHMATGYKLTFYDRSGMGARGIIHLAGLIDSDYRGELCVLLYPLNVEARTALIAQIEEGNAVCQCVLEKTYTERVVFDPYHERGETVTTTARGTRGFGSTDGKRQVCLNL